MGSTARAFPAALGWFRFKYGAWWYYIRAVGRGLQVYRFSVRPNRKCRKVFKGMRNFCGVSNGGRTIITKITIKQIRIFYTRLSGFWSIRLRGFSLLKFKFSNGWISIRRFRVKVQLSMARAFPASLGWFRFKYGAWWYYIRAVGRGIQVYRFSVKPNSKCRKVFKGMRNFCGVSNGGRMKIPVHTVHVLLKRFTGFTFRFPSVKFNFVIRGGRIVVGGHAMKLVPSGNKRFPTSKGWYLFRYMGWTYFISFSSRGIKVVGMHGHKIVTGNVHGNGGKPGRITWFKTSRGNWSFKFEKFAIKFYSWGNGWITINGKKIKLTVSTNSGLPASQGYVWFRWAKITYYLRFYGGRFYVYSFGAGCKRVFHKVRGFCGYVNINKGCK